MLTGKWSFALRMCAFSQPRQTRQTRLSYLSDLMREPWGNYAHISVLCNTATGSLQRPTSANASSMRAIATTQLPNARTATVRIEAMRGSSQTRTEIPIAITR